MQPVAKVLELVTMNKALPDIKRQTVGMQKAASPQGLTSTLELHKSP